MIALHAELCVRPPHQDEVQNKLRGLLALTESEPGSLIYAIHREQQTLLLYELYRDQRACDAHLASRAVVAALSQLAPLLVEPPRVRMTQLLAGRFALEPGTRP
jgi:quinol monooxygenase YgiN